MKRLLFPLLLIALTAINAHVLAGDAVTDDSREFRSLDQRVQALKKDVLDLNRELFMLEEELLFPANSQVAMFVSLDVGDFFDVESVTLSNV